MTQFKITPGPWVTDGSGMITAPNNTTRPLKNPNSAFWHVASVTDGNRGPHEAIANAKLIASAPELLEALVSLLDVAEWSDHTAAAISAAQSAIKKAINHE